MFSKTDDLECLAAPHRVSSAVIRMPSAASTRRVCAKRALDLPRSKLGDETDAHAGGYGNISLAQASGAMRVARTTSRPTSVGVSSSVSMFPIGNIITRLMVYRSRSSRSGKCLSFRGGYLLSIILIGKISYERWRQDEPHLSGTSRWLFFRSLRSVAQRRSNRSVAWPTAATP